MHPVIGLQMLTWSWSCTTQCTPMPTGIAQSQWKMNSSNEGAAVFCTAFCVLQLDSAGGISLSRTKKEVSAVVRCY